MIKIFAPQMQIDCYRDWFIESEKNTDNAEFIRVTDINEIKNEKIKIAAIPMYYEQYDPENKYNFNPTDFDLCLISDVEQTSFKLCQEWARDKGIKKYCLAIGSLEFARVHELPSNILYRPWWMYNLLDTNKLHTLDISEKSYNFDVLLGAKKQHRDFVMAKFQMKNMLKDNIVNYRSVFLGPYGNNNLLNEYLQKISNNIIYPYVSPNLKPEWEVRDTIEKDVSNIIPWKIYNQTKYSIICESNYENGFFATEKTGKAFLAKRIFIVFSAANFLSNLHDLGFKTFDGIIDESYDKETDIIKRFEMAFEQICWLSSQDYGSIMHRAMPILEHNHHHLIKLRQETKQRMRKMVYNTLEEIKC